jgi:hypothetical protein
VRLRTTSIEDPANARLRRAIGTPLDWPEAKKVAGHVRSWGIEVRQLSNRALFKPLKTGHELTPATAATARHLATRKGQGARRPAVG